MKITITKYGLLLVLLLCLLLCTRSIIYAAPSSQDPDTTLRVINKVF